MGNQLVGAAPGQILSVENYLNELPSNFQTTNFVGLGSTRFFKVARIPHEEGSLVVKVLIKPDASLQLKSYGNALQEIRDVLVSTNNCLPFQVFYETDRVGILIRQYVRDNLYDRISTRPFLSPTEKLWILYQLLHALKEAHGNGVCHGDIKTENVMVTSWNWVLLTDFASFKPVHLPEDDPADFSFYFDASRRRVCYIAPERFVEVKSGGLEEAAAPLPPPQAGVTSPVPMAGSGGSGKLAGDAQPLDPAGPLRSSVSDTSTPPTAAKVAINPSDVTVSFVAGKEPKPGLAQEQRDSELTKDMDVFSLGCVAAELFCDGVPLFNLSQLLAYRHGLYDPADKLAKIANPDVVNLIQDMIALDPAKRLSPSACLQKYRGLAFPVEFSSFLAVYCRRFCGEPILTADDRIGRLRRDMVPVILKRLAPPPSPTSSGVVSPGSSTCPDDVDAQRVQPAAGTSDDPADGLSAPPENIMVAGDTSPKKSPAAPSDQQVIAASQPAGGKYVGGTDCLVVIASILTSSIRHCCSFQAKLTGLELMNLLSRHCGDQLVLERFVPYMTQLLSDEVPEVRAMAIRSLALCTKLVKTIPRSDANLFPEYILPAIHPLAAPDSDLIVRISLAEHIVILAETALRFLETSQIDAVDVQGSSASEMLQYQGSYDTELLALHEMMQKQVVALLCDPVNTVKRTLLENGISQLCIFFGRQKANDVLLSHMITFQNDKHDWQLRGAFFDSIVAVAAYVGAQSLSMVMPLLQQGLGDVEETVVHKALEALTALCELGLFHKQSLQALSQNALPFLCHPNKWLRYAAVGFITSMARALNIADLHCLLLPNLNAYLAQPICQVSDKVVVLTSLKPPLPRKVYDNLVREPQLDDFFNWLERQSGSRRLNKPHLSYDPIKISSSLQTLLNKISPLSACDEEHLWRTKDYIIRMQRSYCGLQETKDGLEGPLAGTVVMDHRHIRVSSLRSGPGADSHLPLTAATLQQPKGSSGKKAASAASDGPAMSEEWNQMFGTGRSATMPRTGRDGTSSEKGSQRRGESRRSQNRQRSSEANLAGKGQASKPRRSSLRPGRSSSNVLDATLSSPVAGLPSPVSVSSQGGEDRQPEAPVVKTASGSAATPASASSSPAPFKQPHFILPDGRNSRATCEDRLRVCRQDLHMLLKHRHEQYQRSVARMEELAVVRGFDSPAGASSWMPKGTLVAHMQEHRSAVNQIVVADDDSLFATCSDDSTVRIWDCSRLQGRSVLPHKSIFTYNKQGGRIQSVLFLDPSHLVAASTDGSMHIINLKTGSDQRMHAIRQTSPFLDLAEKDHIISMHPMNNGNVLVNTTLHGRIVGCDLRSSKIAWSLQNPLHHGLVTASAVDRLNCWLAVGTSNGTHVCWDMRFHLPVANWTHPANLAVERMSVHPLNQSRLISSTSANNEVSVWNMETSSRTLVFWGSSLGQPLSTSRKSNHYIRALCTHQSLGGDCILLGSSDKRVRLFNMAKPLESALLLPAASDAGSQGNPGPGLVGKYRKLQCDNVDVLQEQVIARAEAKAGEEDPKRRGPDLPAPGHLDAITSLAVTTAGQNFLLTASRDGMVKVWK